MDWELLHYPSQTAEIKGNYPGYYTHSMKGSVHRAPKSEYWKDGMGRLSGTRLQHRWFLAYKWLVAYKLGGGS